MTHKAHRLQQTVRDQFKTFIERAWTEDFFPYGDLGRQLNGDQLLDHAGELCRRISLERWRDLRIDYYEMVTDVLMKLDPQFDRDDDDDAEWATMIELSVDSLCRKIMMDRWGCDH